MASLQKIRNHGGLLITVVGIAMLAFILGDTLSNSSFIKNFIFGNDPETVGIIEGNRVHISEYEAAKDQLTEVYKMEYGRSDFDEDAYAQIRNQVWNAFVMDYTMREQADKVGLAITQDELTDLCTGNHIHQIIRGRRAFADENGQFNREIVKNVVNMLAEGSSDPEQNAYLQRVGKYWNYLETMVRMTYMQEKYNALLQHLVAYNSLDAEYAFNGRQNGVSAEYVMQPYFMVPDSLVKVKESDIKKLYNEHKELYKQTPNRAIKYVVLNIVPSDADYKDAQDQLVKLQNEFYTTEDVAEVVNANSDIHYDGRDYSVESVPALFKEFAFAKGAKAGDHTDILFDNESQAFVTARLVKVGYNMPDSVELKVVMENGEDQELGWFTEDRLINFIDEQNSRYYAGWPKEQFVEKAFTGKRGTSFDINSIQFEIMDISKATPKVKMAILAREVSTSNNTTAATYAKARKLVVENKTAEEFEAAAQEQGLAVIPQFNLEKTTEKIGQIKGSRAVVRWAFDAKEGALSDVFDCGDLYIVAALTEVNDGEYRSLESVRAELNAEAINNAKAAYLTEKLAGIKTLEEAAETLGQAIQTANRVTLSDARFGTSGMEPAVIGATIALGENALSEPIKGNTGVYVVKTGGNINMPGEFNADAEKGQMSMRLMYMPYQAMQLIQDEADITDNRANFQ